MPSTMLCGGNQMPKIWYKHEDCKPEVIDTCGKHEVGYMLSNYQMAFGCAYGQHRYGKDRVWVGLKRDMPELLSRY